MKLYITIGKPFMDYSIGFLGLLFLLPIFLLLFIFLTIANNGYAFYIQPRPGKNEKIFYIIKFRTMNDKRDKKGNLLPDAMRLTWIGKFIRSISLDEIPQLINVLRGEMSFVGPRPLLTEYLSLYSSEQRKRHLVKPGITGWAQINGRNSATWQERFLLDIWYVNNVSFWLDMRIIFKTIKKVFLREGISQEGQATVEKFKGNK